MKARDSRIELLRIICMFFIVLSHFSIFGNWYGVDNFSPFETVRTLLFDGLGPAAAICFFIITGYFSFKEGSLEKRIKKSATKFFNVWGQTFFYSATIGTLLFIVKQSDVTSLVKAFLPFTLNEYWFVTCYLLLVLFSPYLDMIGDNLSSKDLKRLLIVLFILQIPALLNNMIINRFLLAILGYYSGKYIFLNKKKLTTLNNKLLWLSFFTLYLIDLLSIFVLRSIGIDFQHSAHFTQYILAFCISVILFLIAINAKPFSSKLVNYISRSAFALYLITEQPTFRHILWGKLLNVGKYQNSVIFPLQGIFVVFGICIVCFLIDFVRRGLLSFFKNRMAKINKI